VLLQNDFSFVQIKGPSGHNFPTKSLTSEGNFNKYVEDLKSLVLELEHSHNNLVERRKQ